MDNISDFFAQPLWLIDLCVVSLRLLKNNFAEEDFTISSIPFGFCVLLLLLSLLLLRLLLPLLLQQHHPALARTCITCFEFRIATVCNVYMCVCMCTCVLIMLNIAV